MDWKVDYRIKLANGGKQKSANRRAKLRRLIAICIGGLLPIAHGAENEVVPETESSQPDLEFLEFLGQFETDDGLWIDPGSLLAEEFDDLLNVAENIARPGNTINDANNNDNNRNNDANN